MIPNSRADGAEDIAIAVWPLRAQGMRGIATDPVRSFRNIAAECL